MIPLTRLFLALAGVMSATPLLAAQQLAVPRSGTVVGTVRDSVSGAPLLGAYVGPQCAGCGYGTHSDSAGNFRLDHLPTGSTAIVLFCPTRTMGFGPSIDVREIEVHPAAPTRLDVRVPPGICLGERYMERAGVFRGHWTPGFESSEFVPCRDASVGLADGIAGLLPRTPAFPPMAWATFAEHSRVRDGFTWPADAPRDDWGIPTFYVVWHGTLRGPGTYGHMGVAAFEFRVDSVMEARRPGPEDCR